MSMTVTGPVLSHLSTLTKIAGLLLMTGWYSSSWWARSLESTNEGSGSGPSLLLYDKILQRRLFAPPAGHPCPASSDKTARPFYDRTARPRHIAAHEYLEPCSFQRVIDPPLRDREKDCRKSCEQGNKKEPHEQRLQGKPEHLLIRPW